mgnify:CR=1 FL=1
MPTASIDGKNCAYQDIGEGFPILFGHSYLWSSKMWEPQIEELSKSFRCIVPDLWNHGQSDQLDNLATRIDELADDYWKLMESLGITEFAVVGLSVGGMWGSELAFKHPDAVKGLVLMDTFLGSEPEVTQKKYFGMLDFLEQSKGFTKPLLDQVVPLFFSSNTAQNKPELLEDFRNSLASMKEETVPGVAALGSAALSLIARDNACPTFVPWNFPSLETII